MMGKKRLARLIISIVVEWKYVKLLSSRSIASYMLYRVRSICSPQKVTFSGTSGETVMPPSCRGCSVFCDWTEKHAVRLINPAAMQPTAKFCALIVSYCYCYTYLILPH